MTRVVYITQLVRGRAQIHVHVCLTPHPQPSQILLPAGLFSTLPRRASLLKMALGLRPLALLVFPPPLIIINCFLAELPPWGPGPGGVFPCCASWVTCPLRCSLARGFPGQEVWEPCPLPHTWSSQGTPAQESF